MPSSWLEPQRRDWKNGTCRALRLGRRDARQCAKIPRHMRLVVITELERLLGQAAARPALQVVDRALQASDPAELLGRDAELAAKRTRQLLTALAELPRQLLHARRLRGEQPPRAVTHLLPRAQDRKSVV